MKLFVVPIRFWEHDAEIEIIEDAHPTGDQHIYGFCTQFGHEAYFMRKDCFETLETCKAEIQRRQAIKSTEDAAEINQILDQMFESR